MLSSSTIFGVNEKGGGPIYPIYAQKTFVQDSFYIFPNTMRLLCLLNLQVRKKNKMSLPFNIWAVFITSSLVPTATFRSVSIPLMMHHEKNRSGANWLRIWILAVLFTEGLKSSFKGLSVHGTINSTNLSELSCGSNKNAQCRHVLSSNQFTVSTVTGRSIFYGFFCPSIESERTLHVRNCLIPSGSWKKECVELRMF